MKNTKSHIRFVTVNGKKYLFVDDVAVVIKEVAATEETDTRNRLNALANNIQQSSRLTKRRESVE